MIDSHLDGALENELEMFDVIRLGHSFELLDAICHLIDGHFDGRQNRLVAINDRYAIHTEGQEVLSDENDALLALLSDRRVRQTLFILEAIDANVSFE